MHPAECASKRLIARAPTGEDEAHYRELLLCEQVGRWLRPPPLKPLIDPDPGLWLARDIAHWREHGFGPWVLIDAQLKDFVGRAGPSYTTLNNATVIELAWAITPPRWGEGLATEAGCLALEVTRELNLGDVFAYTLTTNTASRRVMEKVGLRELGQITRAGLAHVLFGSQIDRSTGETPAS